MAGKRRSSLSTRLAGRNGEIWRLHVNGMTQDAIAEKYGISQPRVSEIIARVQADIPERTRKEVIARQVELLERLQTEVLELWERPPVPAYSNGRPILDDEGKTVEDHTYRTRALETALKVMDRHAKMLGLDAPQKIEAQVEAQVTQMPPEVAGRIQAARMRTAQREKRLKDGDVA